MEKLPNQEGLDIRLRKANIENIPVLIEIEESAGNLRIYSPTLTEAEWIKELQKAKVFLVEKNGIVAGNVSYEIKSKDEAYVSGLITKPEFQGKGVGRKALEMILDELKDYKRITLVTHPDNKNALELYKSFGFEIEFQSENHFGDGEARVFMALEKK